MTTEQELLQRIEKLEITIQAQNSIIEDRIGLLLDLLSVLFSTQIEKGALTESEFSHLLNTLEEQNTDNQPDIDYIYEIVTHQLKLLRESQTTP